MHHGRSSERGHERHAERFQWGHVSTFMVLFVVSRLLFSDTSQKVVVVVVVVCVISSVILMEKSLQKSKICVFLQKQI